MGAHDAWFWVLQFQDVVELVNGDRFGWRRRGARGEGRGETENKRYWDLSAVRSWLDSLLHACLALIPVHWLLCIVLTNV